MRTTETEVVRSCGGGALQKNYREKAMCCAVKDTVEAARGCAVVYRVYVGG